jgi:hypothetical protein
MFKERETQKNYFDFKEPRIRNLLFQYNLRAKWDELSHLNRNELNLISLTIVLNFI